MERSQKTQIWLTGVIAFATLVYAVVTLIMFFQLKASNDLLRSEQRVTLRPYIDIQFLGVAFEDATAPEEKWQINTVWSNNGQLPAIQMQVYTWIDYHSDILVEKKPADLIKYSLGPHGAATTTQHTITKQEALNLANEHGNCYLHIVVWYSDPRGRDFTSRYSYRMD